MKFLCEVLDIQNYILMGFNINECFYEKFGQTQLYSNGILYEWSFLLEILDIHNYILMSFYINEVFYGKVWTYTIIFLWDSILMTFFMRSIGQTQLYSNEFLY